MDSESPNGSDHWILRVPGIGITVPSVGITLDSDSPRYRSLNIALQLLVDSAGRSQSCLVHTPLGRSCRAGDLWSW